MNLNEQDIEKVKERVRKYWKDCLNKKLGEDDGPWPKVITYGEDFPITKAEIYKDGSVGICPRIPLNWISQTIVLDNIKDKGDKE